MPIDRRLSIHKTLHQPIEGFPKVVISAFQEYPARLLENYESRRGCKNPLANFKSWSMGITIETNRLVNAPVGAALRDHAIEDLIQFGAEKTRSFGTCGVLDRDIEANSLSFQHKLRRGDQLPLIFRLVMKWK